MNTVIQIKNLSKQYRLGQVGSGTISHDLQAWWAGIRGKENPNLKIGSENRLDSVDGDLVWALRNINFEVKQGEVLGIIGKNGAGKSTLLKILSRVTTPTTGEINVKGRIASLLEVGTGFHPELTGRENIFINGAILGMSKAEIKSKLDEIIDFSGVDKYIDTPVKRYSSGMYVRLAFAVAAHLDPEILVVDEVLAVGDAEFQKKCLGKMKDVAGEGRTVLFVSHNMTAVNSLCTKAIYLKNGTVKMEDNVGKVINYYLSDDHQSGSSVSWEEGNAPGDDFVKLISAKLIDKNRTATNSVMIGKKQGIEIVYKVYKDIRQPVPQVHFFLNKSDNVFINYCSIEKLGISNGLLSGVYTFVVWIPEYLLNIGIYTVGIGLSDMEKIKLHCYSEEALSLEVIEDLNTRELFYKGAIGGILRPNLNWELIGKK